MANVKARVVVGVLLSTVWLARLDGQASLTAQDRTEIQNLVASYARALGTCAAEEYADLFAPGGGYFFSSIRGEVRTRESLILLVRSERHCNPPATGTAAAPRPMNAPTVAIEPTSDGAKGVASLGNAGSYEDVYVKTSKGWRFKARSVITPPEANAQLTARDFADIRRLAGDDRGQFDDVFVDTPNGKRFRSSGLTLAVIPEGVKGTAILKHDGGRYEDVYVKDANGWRFKSRAYAPPSGAAR
jgi:hypothetical protein